MSEAKKENTFKKCGQDSCSFKIAELPDAARKKFTLLSRN